ncbi:hypothetical protein YC2023_111021 [Brassica napus]
MIAAPVDDDDVSEHRESSATPAPVEMSVATPVLPAVGSQVASETQDEPQVEPQVEPETHDEVLEVSATTEMGRGQRQKTTSVRLKDYVTYNAKALTSTLDKHTPPDLIGSQTSQTSPDKSYVYGEYYVDIIDKYQYCWETYLELYVCI